MPTKKTCKSIAETDAIAEKGDVANVSPSNPKYYRKKKNTQK
jgi:hypothetical protein